MHVSLSTEFGSFVDELVSTGAFATPEAVVAEALRRLRDDQTKFESLKNTFDEAIAELDQTGGTPLDFAEIKRKGRERLAARNRQ
jgi:putative addiction module CopG family antidote